METQELLGPRYKVIAYYPASIVKIGDIIELPSDDWIYGDENKTRCESDYFETYPNVFQKLQWWQERKPEDMPDYLKDVHGEVWRVREYTKSNVVYLLKNFKDNDFPYGDHDLYDLSPATKEEYDNHQNPTQ